MWTERRRQSDSSDNSGSVNHKQEGLAGGHLRALSDDVKCDRYAGERTRTSDPRITNALLYQLSYPGIEGGYVNRPKAVGNGWPEAGCLMARMSWRILLSSRK
jgi:hypothetical protein